MVGDAGDYHPERLQVQRKLSAQAKKWSHVFYGSPRRHDALRGTAGETHQPPGFILKGTANATTNWETKDQEKQYISFTLGSCKSCVTPTTLFPNSVSPQAAAVCQRAADLSSDTPQGGTQPTTTQALAITSCPTSRSHTGGDSSPHNAIKWKWQNCPTFSQNCQAA